VNTAIERALALAEPDRLIFPFVMTESVDLLEALPRHETAHAALFIDILDVLRGASLAAKDRPVLPPERELTPTELRVLRFLPTNMSRTEIARELYLAGDLVMRPRPGHAAAGSVTLICAGAYWIDNPTPVPRCRNPFPSLVGVHLRAV
jgi:hypothetical protein